MFKKLKLAYVAVFYKLCMFVTSWVKKVMLHLINFQGLDPSRDVAAEQHRELYELLSKEFSENPKRSVSRIPVDVAASKHDIKHRAYKVKHLWPYDAIPDVSYVTSAMYKINLPEPLQVVKDPVVETVEVVSEVVVAPEVVEESVPEVAEEDILETISIVAEEVVVPVPVKRRKPRVVASVKKTTKKLVKKPVKKVVKKYKKK